MIRIAEKDVPDIELAIDPDDFPGFKVRVGYISQGKLTEIAEQCNEVQTKRRGSERRVNVQKFNRRCLQEALRSWSGFHSSFLETMAPIDVDPDWLDSEGNVQFSLELAKALTDHLADADFMGPIIRTVTNYSNYKKVLEARDLGNSDGSSTTSATPSGRARAESAGN